MTLLLSSVLATFAPASMKVTNQIVADELTPWFVGAGIEDVNHELVGGLWTQMVWGESFEEPADQTGVSTMGTNGLITWLAASSTNCTYNTVKGDAQTGNQSQIIAGEAGCGVLNRGLDGGGMFFQVKIDIIIIMR